MNLCNLASISERFVMIDVNDFSDIRPYTDEEVPEAVEKLLKEPLLYKVMDWLYPNFSEEDTRQMLSEVKSVDDFQENISGPAFKVITRMTTSGLTFTNMDNLKKDESYLFLSNHRDIILDSALLNVSLLEKGYKTTQIAIGDNLLQNQLIYDVVRLNKNFIVNRNVNPKEMLLHSKRLSAYIRKTIVEENTSIWIAHKEGRSKDNDDRTANGLLKMLTMHGEGTIEDKLHSLNILPTVVSYEYDPCDLFKVLELLSIKQTGEYKKQKGEDFKSMMKGLTGHKGGVNIAVGTVLKRRIEALKDIDNKNDKIKMLAAAIDRQMHDIYKLWPSNYIAYDLLHGTRKYKEHYTNLQRIAFRNYVRSKVIQMSIFQKKLPIREGFNKMVKELLLQMYANPVINKLESSKDEPVKLS